MSINKYESYKVVPIIESDSATEESFQREFFEGFLKSIPLEDLKKLFNFRKITPDKLPTAYRNKLDLVFNSEYYTASLEIPIKK